MYIIHFFLCSDKSLGVTPSVNIDSPPPPAGPCGFCQWGRECGSLNLLHAIAE